VPWPFLGYEKADGLVARKLWPIWGERKSNDLRDKFVVGAGSTYAVGASGGSVTHSHTFTGDGHTHDIATGAAIGGGFDYNDTTQSTPAVGTSDAEDNLPPYHALVYIQKT